ncbi:MAG: SH3 domain-containing protein [Chloroflexi bacterium]|nr:SH3 domain-containing protein [Chloroflexota bacterium]
MRRSSVAILVVLCLLIALPIARAQDELPICTRAEFLRIFDLVVDYQARFAEPPADFTALMTYSQQHASDRLTVLAQLPQCVEALEFGALLVQLGGDFAARAALELAGTPAADNPYLTLPDHDQQINDRLAATFVNDRSLAQAPEQRQLPTCATQQLDAYAAAAADLLGLLSTADNLDSRDAFSAVLNERLTWRANRLPALPLCAETIALAQALNAALTDSATSLSFAFVGVPAAQNPFIALAEVGMERIASWQAPSAPGTAAAALRSAEKRHLPACSRDQLDSALAAIDSDFLPAFKETGDALQRSQLHLDYRGNVLSPLPVCDEVFALRWWLDEWLGAPESENRARLDDALLRLEAARASAPLSSQIAACSDADLRFVTVYITPVFHSLMRASLSTTDFAQQQSLEQESLAFRALLWAHLPRCDDAVRLGMQMRDIAADFVAAIKLESDGAFAVEIPYTLALPNAIVQLGERLNAIEAVLGIGETQTWFVDVEGFANVRSCGSTACGVVAVVQGGDPLDVLDDSGDWFELRLPSGGTGYIAAFLVSETPVN